jgi:hypothetical protein
MERVFVVLSLLLVFSLSVVSARDSMNERLAQARTAEYSQCLSHTALRFINASLIVLSAESELDDLATSLNASTHNRLMSRFMTHVTQSMASGLSFCQAFARAAGGLVGEWTRNRIPVSEHEYHRHCESVMRATDEADEYLFKGPAFRNRLYKCLRLAFLIPVPVG